MTSDPELVLVAVAARTLGVSERLLRKRAEQGRLRFASVERDGRTVAVVRLDEAAVAVGRTPRPDPSGPIARPAPDPAPEELRTGPDPTPDPVRTAPDPSGRLAEESPPENRAPAPHGDALGAPASTSETRPEPTPHKPAEPVELVALRARLVALEAELAAAVERAREAEAAERATNRYADRVEARMAAKEKEALTLARALGHAEGERARLLAGPVEKPRRSWFARLFGRQ